MTDPNRRAVIERVSSGDLIQLASDSGPDVIVVPGLAGNVTVSFAALSYAGTLTITILVDPDRWDLSALAQDLQAELDALI